MQRGMPVRNAIPLQGQTVFAVHTVDAVHALVVPAIVAMYMRDRVLDRRVVKVPFSETHGV